MKEGSTQKCKKVTGSTLITTQARHKSPKKKKNLIVYLGIRAKRIALNDITATSESES